MPQPQSLADFIRDSHVQIIQRFETFARTFSDVAAGMTSAELQDHADELLTAIAEDLNATQTLGEQVEKSEGRGALRAMAASGHLHAEGRIGHGFSVAQVMAEFRALRASVLSSYIAQCEGPADLAGIGRFNEAIDEALTSSIVRFSERLTGYRDQFIGMLGHDLRSPVSAITNGAHLLSMSGERNPQLVPRIAELILRSARRMDGMIADLLDLTRSRLGTGIPVQLAAADLGEICTLAVLEAQATHPENVIAYEPAGDLHGHWDTSRITQVAVNLLNNALDHGAGSPVRLEVTGLAKDIKVRVSNGGPVIPRETLASIFEPLAHHSPTRRSATAGLGLGLFIVHAIVTAHHGTVTATSTESEGTTFELCLPRGPTANT